MSNISYLTYYKGNNKNPSLQSFPKILALLCFIGIQDAALHPLSAILTIHCSLTYCSCRLPAPKVAAFRKPRVSEAGRSPAESTRGPANQSASTPKSVALYPQGLNAKHIIATSTGTYESKPIAVKVKGSSGVEIPVVDAEPTEPGEAEAAASAADHCFFTIDGMPAGSNADRLAPGIYIERDHGKTRKFIKHLR